METYPLKEIAVDFLKLCSRGDSRAAFAQYAAAGFRHHNAYFPGDAQSLMVAMEENARQMPGKVLDVKRVLQDGDLVAVHSHMRPQPDSPGVALVHIFRFENGRLAELWDIGQPVPADTANENGMF